MNRLLYINGSSVDIDDQTAIGIDYQTYDVKDIGKSKVKISNMFTIPKTANNLNIFGYPDNPSVLVPLIIYNSMTCDYYMDNEKVVTGATVRIEEIDDRISLYIADKLSIWDQMKLLSWEDFVEDFVTYLQDEKGYPSVDSPGATTLAAFLPSYTTATEGLIIPLYFGHQYDLIYGAAIEGYDNAIDTGNIWLSWIAATGDYTNKHHLGGHICAYMKTIFQYIEWKYSVNFLTTETGITGNLWDDPYASKIYVPMRNLTFRMQYNIADDTRVGYYLAALFEGSTYGDFSADFYPLEGVKDKEGKTLYDCINGFFQHFNVIKEDIQVNGQPAIFLARFDDIKTLAPVIDFGELANETPVFYPKLGNYARRNYIKFKSVYENGGEFIGSRELQSNNVNLDATSTILEIDAHIPSFMPINGGVVPNLRTKESFKTFEYLISSGTTVGQITVNTVNLTLPGGLDGDLANFTLQKAALYSLSSEYTFLDEIIDFPKVYKVKKWLTLNDLLGFRFFAQYFIRQLNGSFFINKIQGFNPEKSNSPTTIELVRISSKTPTPVFTTNYWTDNDEPFTDGFGYNFTYYRTWQRR